MKYDQVWDYIRDPKYYWIARKFNTDLIFESILASLNCAVYQYNSYDADVYYVTAPAAVVQKFSTNGGVWNLSTSSRPHIFNVNLNNPSTDHLTDSQMEIEIRNPNLSTPYRMLVNLYSQKECPKCFGAKQIWNSQTKMMEDCQTCKATGKV